MGSVVTLVRWQQQSRTCQFYLATIYLVSIPFGVLCFAGPNNFSLQWLLLTVISVFVATINVRLPKLSAVISMGDVFIILVLMQFGPGPALLTYWTDIIVAHSADLLRRHGIHLKGKILAHKWLFNIACCTVSTWTMWVCYTAILRFPVAYPVNLVLALFGLGLGWFFVNTATLSIALSFWMNRSFWAVWREGIVLCLLNFLGSAAAAGLSFVFYDRVGFLIFVLCVPLAGILYQLYHFYIQKYEQAQNHIAQLNKLYLQTVEALASAVDAKDRYTHGHIRRVQAYAVALAECMGVKEERELMGIKAGALLHDIGKIAIPEFILNKPTVLTETEYEKMKIHPAVGAVMLKDIEFPYPVLPLVKSHHERWDGNGYPEGLKGDEIPLSARILSLVDCYDALTTNRPYRSPMSPPQIIELFRKESGRAYDPNVVESFVANLERIEEAGKAANVSDVDPWSMKESTPDSSAGIRPLERVQPTLNYSRALATGRDVQRELYSIFDFARAGIQCWNPKDIFAFIELKLSRLIQYDAAVFYIAKLTEGTVVAEHVGGIESQSVSGLKLRLEQKLTGWVAANNQALSNLPPFPDFLYCEEPKPQFQMSAIVPLNRNGVVLGAIALYRKEQVKFTEQEFRQLELVASQTAIALGRCSDPEDDTPLIDSVTGLPNSLQLHLMFDQISTDAERYDYPLALFAIQLDEVRIVNRRWGSLSGNEAVRAVAKYLTAQLRETDLLVRSTVDGLLALSPRMNGKQAEALKSRIQDDLERFRFTVRNDIEIGMPASIGIAVFPHDGTELESLLSVADWRLRQDSELREVVKRHAWLKS